MFLFDQVTAYLLVVCLLSLLAVILIWQQHRTQRTIPLWLAASVVGILLGSIGSYAGMRLAGYKLIRVEPATEGVVPGAVSPGMAGPPGMGGSPSMGGPAAMGGMGGAPSMGSMGGMGGPPAPRPKRDLATLVRKMDLLTGDIMLSLTAEQAVAVGDCLKDLEKAPNMSDNDAKAKHEKILAVFNDGQKARLDAIGLPRPARGGAGGPGAGGGSGGAGGPGAGGGPAMGGMGGMGGARQEEPANPFTQETEGKALKTLRDRLASKGAADKQPPKK